MAFIKSMDDLYFPEHYRIVMIYPSSFRKKATWCIYDTRMYCEIDRISVKFVMKLLKDKRIFLHNQDHVLQRDFYKATDYKFFEVKLTPAREKK